MSKRDFQEQVIADVMPTQEIEEPAGGGSEKQWEAHELIDRRAEANAKMGETSAGLISVQEVGKHMAEECAEDRPCGGRLNEKEGKVHNL